MASGSVPTTAHLKTPQFWNDRGLLTLSNQRVSGGNDEQQCDDLSTDQHVVVEYETINRLWGGSGDTCELGRVCLKLDLKDRTVSSPSSSNESAANKVIKTQRHLITKLVDGPSRRHRRDSTKSLIKSRSYTIESRFLNKYSAALKAEALHIPQVIDFVEDQESQRSLIIMSNLLDTHPVHVKNLDMLKTKGALRWLARFHAHFWCMSVECAKQPRSQSSDNGRALAKHERNEGRLWSRGGYWSLGKREKERNEMLDCWDELLKERQRELDRQTRRSRRRGGGTRSRSHSLGRRRRRRRGRSRSRDNGRRRQRRTSLDLLGRRLERAADWISDATSPIQESDIPCPTGTTSHRSNRDGRGSLEWKKNERGHSTSGLVRWLREMDSSCGWTVIHGDFKAENLFFKFKDNDSNDEVPDCAVCDFQWTGS
jgi:hypothetical protein